MIKCIVVDDEPLARQGMEMLIKEVSFLDLAGMFSNVIDADEFLRHNKIEILFLDIQMPELNGLEYLKIASDRPLVIITTAYPEYALDGFNLDVVDYLTKPIKFERFYQSIRKCVRLLAHHHYNESQDQRMDETIFVRSDRKFLQIKINDISHIEAMKDYVLIDYDDKKIPVSMNLKAIESQLDSNQFIRVHKSYIVNIRFIQSIEKDLIDIGKCEITIGDKYKENVLGFLALNKVIKRDY